MTSQAIKPGNFIMAGIPGTELDQETLSLIREYNISSFILFSRNTQLGPEKLKSLCTDIRDACLEAGLKNPIITVDQEGGDVQRLSAPFWPKIPSNMEVSTSGDPVSEVLRQAEIIFETLSPFGINLNLAPVLDLSNNNEGVLKGRTYGDNPYKAGGLGTLYIKALQKKGIMAAAKHFPGIGLSRKDPHIERPFVTEGMEILSRHLLPFEMAIKSRVSSMMTSHVVFETIDPSEPATFSKTIASRFLRDELGFEGMLLTDDLEMGGITKFCSVEKAALKAFISGHDMLLICHSHERARRAAEALGKAMDDGTIPRERWEEATERINKLL